MYNTKEHYASTVPQNKDINFVYDTELVMLQCGRQRSFVRIWNQRM